jgi:hypothetical protein
MIWYWIAGLLTVVALALLIFNYSRDRKYLKKKTSEAMSRGLKEEIEEEREESLRRKKEFDEAMKEAKGQR